MNIGKKVKDLRTSKLMTQKELAGNEITRNMLSRIESGSATPSLSTLKYLSERLGVPIGYLVSEDETDENYYKKYTAYENITEAFKKEEWQICADLCRECLSGLDDNELTYLYARASAELGMQNFNDGNLKKALTLFEECAESLGRTIFGVDEICARVSPYKDIMLMISPSLDFDMGRETAFSVADDLCMYRDALLEINTCGDRGGKCKNEFYEYAISAKKLSRSGMFEAAIGLYSQISKDDSLPKPVIYLILEDYEQCCKETEDYKNAYELSQIKIRLLEKMLAED